MIYAQKTSIADICPRCQNYGALFEMVDSKTGRTVEVVCDACLDEEEWR